MKRTKLSEHPSVADKLIALLFWWLPILALLPVISKSTSEYVRAHAKGVWVTFVAFIALLAVSAIGEGLRLFGETGNALSSIARAVPTFEAILTDFARVFASTLDIVAGNESLPLSTFWLLAALVNTFAVQQGRGPYFFREAAQRLLVRTAGILALLLAVLALTVGFVTAGEAGQIYDDAGLATTFVGIVCSIIGITLLKFRHIVSTMISLMGGSMILAGLYIQVMAIRLDDAFLIWLGVVTLGIGLFVRAVSSWWTRRKARQISADKGAT